MGSILQLLLPLTQEVNSSGGSEVNVDQQEDLQAVLHQLKGVAQSLASSPQVRDSLKWVREEVQNKADLVV